MATQPSRKECLSTSPWSDLAGLTLSSNPTVSIEMPALTRRSCEHVEAEMSAPISPQLPASWTESTDELLASIMPEYPEPCSCSPTSTIVDVESTTQVSPVVENTQPDICIVSVELAEQRNDNLEVSTDNTTGRHSVDSTQSSVPPRLEVSKQDIELDGLTSPRLGTQSTDELVPPPEGPVVDAPLPCDRISPPSATIAGPGTKSERVTPRQRLPDYKPIPLRWPFQVLLVTMIAGLFTFFEYQIHNLPPVRYKMFDSDPLEKEKVAVPVLAEAKLPTPEAATSTYLRPSPVIKSTIVAPITAQTSGIRNSAKAVRRGLQIPAPTPDPRPHSSEYPRPVELISTFCGWAPPVWVVYREVESISAWIVGQEVTSKSITPVTRVMVEQTFPTFWSKNESWCPCLVELDDTFDHWKNDPKFTDWPWTAEWGPRRHGPDFWVSTHDKECGSILSALSLWNQERWHTSFPPSLLALSINIRELSTELTVSEHPVSQLPWLWPTTNSEGQVLIPLTCEGRNGPTETGPDNFGNTDVTEPYCMLQWTSWPQYSSQVWWTLPFARASRISATTTALNTTTGTIHSSNTLETSDQQATTNDTARVATRTETHTNKSGSPKNSLGEATTIESQGESTSHMIEEGIQSTLGPSESQERGLSAVATPTSSDVSRSKSIGGVTISAKDDRKEPVSPETLAPPTPIVTSSPLSGLLEDHRESAGTIEHSKSTEPDQTANFPIFVSSELSQNTNPLTFPSPQTNLEKIAPIKTPGEKRPMPILVTSSTYYSLRLDPETNDGFSSLDNTVLLSGLPTTLVFSVSPPNRTGTFSGKQPSATDNAMNPQSPSHPSGPIPPGSAALFHNLHTEGDFLMASLVPVLLATVLGIAVQVFTSNLGAMIPFRGLVYGAYLNDSVMLPRNSGIFTTPFVSIRFLRHYRDPLPLLNSLLNILAAVLVPLSSEAIRLEISTTCKSRPPRLGHEPSPLTVCAFGLRKSGITMRLSEGILVAMVILILTIGYLLLRWDTGVATEPWSIASLASLMSDDGLKDAIKSIPRCPAKGATHIRDKEIRNVIGEGRRFRIGYHQRTTSSSELVYGIHVVRDAGCDSPVRLTIRDPPERKSTPVRNPQKWWRSVTADTKQVMTQRLALLLTTGLLVLILYYEVTISPSTKFEEFMDSQSFGVRILFTALGTAIGWFWDDYFCQISSKAIYQRLAASDIPQPARTSILVSSQSLDPFSAIYRSIKPSLNKPLLAIAVVRLFAKLTPILFSAIPFRNTITFTMHEACTWLAIAFLFLMMIVLLLECTNMLSPAMRRWSGKQKGDKRQDILHMPVNVDTIVGSMYYLSGSNMLRDFEGLSLLGRRERDRLVCEMGRKYAFRDGMIGISGEQCLT